MEVIKYGDGFGPNKGKCFHEYEDGRREEFEIEIGFDKPDPNHELHMKWLINPGPRYDKDNWTIYELNY